MKTITQFLFVVMVALLFVMTGCKRDIVTKTEIFADGSCERTVMVDGDSSDIYDMTFPIPHDPTWNIITQDVEGEPDIIARRQFTSVAEMNDYYQNYLHGEFKVPVEVKLEKRFRWFSTFFRYSETYKVWNPYTNPPVEEYLTAHDLKVYAETGNSDTLRIDKKIELWWQENIIEDLYQSMIETSELLHFKEITVTKLTEKKRDLRNKLYEIDIMEADSEEVILALQKVLQSEEVQTMKSYLDQATKEMEKEWEFFWLTGSTEFENSVMMPGLIVESNADIIEGNTVKWKLSGEQFTFTDYEMWVESRVVNRWALYMTVGLCLILVLAGIGLAVKRR